jgi:hypothetical protein
MRPDIEAIEARVNAATPGPWTFDESTGGLFFGSGAAGDASFDTDAVLPMYDDEERDAVATFMANARTDVPALIAYVRELEAQVASKSDLLQTTRERWTAAQSRLADIEGELNRMTGQQCGINDNLAWLANPRSEVKP